MKYYHDQHIGIYKNAFPNEWCDKVVNYFKNNANQSIPRTKKKDINPGIRDTQLCLQDNLLIQEFNKVFFQIFNLYEDKYPHIIKPLNIDSYTIQKTLPTEGFHPYHIEQGNLPPSSYRVSVYTVYLNDVEEGGETEFLYQLKRIKPEKGTACIFPASYTHVHRGNTPFSGEKYIITGWLSMPSPDNIEK